MGNLEEGLALAKDGVSRFADNIGLWGLACDFLRRLDRPQEERAMTLEILRRFPPEKSVKSCGLNLVRIHERIHGQLPAIESPDIQAIIARIRQWAKNTPNHPDIWWFQAAIAEKLNRSGDALAAMDAIERRFPDNPAVYERRANILSKMNRATAALEYRRKALALRPNSVGYTQALLDELVKNGDFSEFDQLMARIKHLLGHKRYGYYRNLFFNLNCHPTYSGGQIWEYFRDWYENAVKPGLPAQKPLNVEPGPRKIRLSDDIPWPTSWSRFSGASGLRNSATISRSLPTRILTRARRTSTAKCSRITSITGWRFRPWATTSWSAKFALTASTS